MKKSRCLGLVGGLGVGATTHYYQKLVKAIEERGRTPEIVIAHAETSWVFDYVQANDPKELASYLCGFISRLKAAGAEVAVIPAVTPHFCLRELALASPLPVLDIFKPLVRELKTRAVRRIAVFGTRSVMESGLFGFAGDVDIIQARLDETDYIHNTYVEIVQTGIGTEEQHRNLTALARTLQQREGVEAIVLAGTDLTLLFNESNTNFPYIDCAAVHLTAIAQGLLSDAARPTV